MPNDAVTEFLRRAASDPKVGPRLPVPGPRITEAQALAAIVRVAAECGHDFTVEDLTRYLSAELDDAKLDAVAGGFIVLPYIEQGDLHRSRISGDGVDQDDSSPG